MKRIERNTYNSLRKSITADTINVEIPVEYTHEGRQGIHEMLTIEKHMRASMICWNSIINGYVIHYVPTVDEYTEAQRMEQESQDIDEVMNTLSKSDRTWNGYEKPAETTETEETSAHAEEQTAETTETEEEEEEQTMKKPSFTIKCIQFHHDENFKMIGNPIYREFAGSTLKEAKAAWKAARDNNDVVKFSPLTIYDIINSEEE